MVNESTLYKILNTFILITCVSCNTTTPNIDDNIVLTYEKDNDETTSLTSNAEDPQSDLVSEFFDHVKEIFEADGLNSSYDVRVHEVNENNFTLTKNLRKAALIKYTTSPMTTRNKILDMFENVTLVSKKYFTFAVTDPSGTKKNKLIKSTTSKEPSTIQQHTKKTKGAKKPVDDYDLLDVETSLGPIAINEQDTDLMDLQTKKLSCILCDNVSNKDCNNPENKLLPLIRCEHTGDMCYSMQTPFGVVDRGCYNPLLNHTTYVCSCNLCNSIPMHDLPHAYTNQTEWLYNVQELSHGRRLRKSVYNQMACIQCEVNQTVNEVPDLNCLEGKYRVLPSQYCNADEICGIKSIKSEGYIWRGCVKYPRYNYLWSFCADDLCNFGAPISLYDIK